MLTAASGRKRAGFFPAVGLAEARKGLERAASGRRRARTDRCACGGGARRTPSFGAFADELFASLDGWRDPKHRAQWRMTLKEYAAPLRPKPVDAITTEDVLTVLRPLWTEKPETASRLRGRIEKVLDAAKAKGHIASPWENPARWRGHLDHLLPKARKLSRGHHPALPFDGVPDFLEELRARSAVAARALEFTILTAARSGETLGARWDEIDFARAVWTIPKERMKGDREHRVPLTKPALAILRGMEVLRVGEFVFPGQKRDRPLSNMAMEMQLRRMKQNAITVHGFRSSFRDWAAEATSSPTTSSRWRWRTRSAAL